MWKIKMRKQRARKRLNSAVLNKLRWKYFSSVLNSSHSRRRLKRWLGSALFTAGESSGNFPLSRLFSQPKKGFLPRHCSGAGGKKEASRVGWCVRLIFAVSPAHAVVNVTPPQCLSAPCFGAHTHSQRRRNNKWHISYLAAARGADKNKEILHTLTHSVRLKSLVVVVAWRLGKQKPSTCCAKTMASESGWKTIAFFAIWLLCRAGGNFVPKSNDHARVDSTQQIGSPRHVKSRVHKLESHTQLSERLLFHFLFHINFIFTIHVHRADLKLHSRGWCALWFNLPPTANNCTRQTDPCSVGFLLNMLNSHFELSINWIARLHCLTPTL